MLTFLHKLCHTPEKAGPEDLQPVHAAGVNDDMIIDALYVSWIMHFWNRVSNALDFENFTPEYYALKAETTVKGRIKEVIG